MILTFVKNFQGQILIDQNRSETLEESMRCSFLVKFEGFRLQLYYQPNSFTGRKPILENIVRWPFRFMLIVSRKLSR